ncbi:tetratricopeptide repeat protein [Neisseria sp. CCUG17229]|uniref:tetratricopeptide repeat protein n=1 Tax=Neisseria sp. CCUG17229 TaxID=3392036 RepID=UPI003A0FC05E
MTTLKFKLTLTVLSAVALSACATPQPVVRQEPTLILPDNPDKPLLPPHGIPYPQLSQQNQINQLGIQVARLEWEIEALRTQLREFEQSGKNLSTPTTASPSSSASKTAPIQRLNDAKLKAAYLNKNNMATAEGDAVISNEARLYNQAIKYYQQGNYAAAAAVLSGANGGNGNEMARRNMYLLLQSQQHMGNCESVIEIGRRYANRFRSSSQAPEALFSIGHCQYQMQQKDIARSTWRKLIQTYPDSEAAKRAAVRIKQR